MGTTQTKRNWRHRLANPVGGVLALLESLGATSWYGGDTITSTAQVLPNLVDDAAADAQRGSTTGVDANDPVFLPHDGSHYVYLPGTASNSITTPRPYATTHFTITKTDDSQVTGTTTADPVVIGGTTHSGSIKSVVLRETTSGGTIGANLVVTDSIDTSANPDAGQTSFVSDATAETWTVNRSTSGLKTAVVTRPVMVFDGTNDYLQLPASDTPTFTDTTGKYTLVVVLRCYTETNDRIFSSESANVNGLSLAQYADYMTFYVGGSSSYDVISTPVGSRTPGGLTFAAVVLDDGLGYAYEPINGLGAAQNYAAVPIGTITHNTPKVGRYAFSTSAAFPGQIFDVLLFDGVALSETQLDDIAATYGL